MKVITDFGSPMMLMDSDSEDSVELSRYGVWTVLSGGFQQIIACSNDLEYLQKIYGPDLHVFPIEYKEEK